MAFEEPRESEVLSHGPCKIDSCGSSDAAATYSSGWVHCFSCGANYPAEGYEDSLGSVQSTSSGDVRFVQGDYRDLNARNISKEVCKKYKYMVGTVPKDFEGKSGKPHRFAGQTVQIENYYSETGELIGQKLRNKDKDFSVIGDISETFFGEHCVKAGGTKTLVITEGAIDAMSYTQARKGWYALSIPNGSDSAKKIFKKRIEYLESFDKIVVAFDNDDAGQKAVDDIKGILSKGTLYIATINGYKDFNEALCNHDVKAILEAVFQAGESRPDGVVSIDDIMEEAEKPIEWGLPWFFPELTRATYGRRYGEVYGLGAGTGVGKTDVFMEQSAYDVVELQMDIGLLFLEQKPVETAKRLAGKIAGFKFHVPDAGWTTEDLKEALSSLKGKVHLYDSFGETEWTNIRNIIRYMHFAKGIKIFYVDHLTAMADTKDEKGSIEQIMKEMAGLANELGIIVHFISHLTTPDGTPHEEGGRVAIRHFKGSRSIGFWSYYMFGLERDQQAEDEAERQITTFRILKDRYTGQSTGKTFELGYDHETGKIIPPSAMDMPRYPTSTDKEEEF